MRPKKETKPLTIEDINKFQEKHCSNNCNKKPGLFQLLESFLNLDIKEQNRFLELNHQIKMEPHRKKEILELLRPKNS